MRSVQFQTIRFTGQKEGLRGQKEGSSQVSACTNNTFYRAERGVKSGQCMYKQYVLQGRKRGQVRLVHVQTLVFRGQKEGSSQVSACTNNMF